MEVSTFSISHSSIALFSTFSRNHSNWHFRFKKSPKFRRCYIVKNVASEKQQKLQSRPAVDEEGVALDALKPDSASIASSIKYHAEFTPAFSPELFELPKAYCATAESVHDMLIINWNATYEYYYEKMDVKQAYYLSMEYLQGRALLNAIGNLELTGAYAEALRKLGHNLEDIARQV